MSRRAVPEVFRGGFFMSLTIAIGALGGFVFWFVVARVHDTETVGVLNAFVNLMILVSTLGQLNISSAVHRFLRGAGHRTRSVLVTGYLATAVTTAIVALVVALSPLHPDELTRISGSVAVLVVMAVTWTAFSIQDHVASTLGRWSWGPLSNTVCVLVRLGLLLLLPATIGGALLAWWVPAALCVVVVSVLLWRGPVAERLATPGRLPSRDRFVRYMFSNWLGATLNTALFSGLPIVVLATAGPRASGVFAVMWLIVQTGQNVALRFGASMLITSTGPGTGRAGSGTAVRLLLVAAAGLALAALLAPLILAAFGAEYAEVGTAPFRVLLLGLFFSVVTVLRSSLWRAEGRNVPIAVTAALQCLPTLALVSAGFAPELIGVAWVFTGASALAALFCAVTPPKRSLTAPDSERTSA